MQALCKKVSGCYKSAPMRSISSSMKITSSSIIPEFWVTNRKKLGHCLSGWYPSIIVPLFIIPSLIFGGTYETNYIEL